MLISFCWSQDLSGIMTFSQADLTPSAESFEDKLAENEDGEPTVSATEKKLLALNDELDETMLRLRRTLMVIRLLGLLSEGEKLKDRLLRDKESLAEFVATTLSTGAKACEGRIFSVLSQLAKDLK